MLATVTMLRFLLCGVEEDFRRISRVDFTEGRPGKGGEWVMTTSAGEPMILPYDPPAGWDPQSFVFVSISKLIFKLFIVGVETNDTAL